MMWNAKNKEWEPRKQDLSPAEINDMSMQMFRVYATNVLIKSVVEAFCECHKQLCEKTAAIKDLISISAGNALCSALKKFDQTRGYRHRTVLELELKGSNYIQGLMDMLWVGIKGRSSGSQSWDTPSVVMHMGGFQRTIDAYLRIRIISCPRYIKRHSF